MHNMYICPVNHKGTHMIPCFFSTLLSYCCHVEISSDSKCDHGAMCKNLTRHVYGYDCSPNASALATCQYGWLPSKHDCFPEWQGRLHPPCGQLTSKETSSLLPLCNYLSVLTIGPSVFYLWHSFFQSAWQPNTLCGFCRLGVNLVL